MKHSNCCRTCDPHPPWPGERIRSVGCIDAPAKSSWCGTPTRCRRPEALQNSGCTGTVRCPAEWSTGNSDRHHGSLLEDHRYPTTREDEWHRNWIGCTGIHRRSRCPNQPPLQKRLPRKRLTNKNQQVTDARLVGLGRFNLNPNLTEVSEIVESTFGFLDSGLVKRASGTQVQFTSDHLVTCHHIAANVDLPHGGE